MATMNQPNPSRATVLAMFRAKYDYLKSVYPSVGSFDEACAASLYQNPDGGWQLNLSPCAAITLRPGDAEAHETHGMICAKWYDEGGAFKEGIPGWLGYPVSDEERKAISYSPITWGDTLGFPPYPTLSVSGPCSEFEFGTIECHDEQSIKEYCVEIAECERRGLRFGGDFNLDEPGTHAYLNEAGKKHVPPDIDDVIKRVDEGIRIMIYLNGEPTVYAKKNADTKNVQPKPQKTAVLPSSAPETESE